MNRPIRFSEFASTELTEAVRWYETQRSGLGAELLEAVDSTVARITTNPELGSPLADDHLTRRLLVKRFPYQVVYRIRPDYIAIVAVAHLKRHPHYWRNRP